MHFESTFYVFNDTGEFDQHAVSGCLDDDASVPGNGRINQFNAMSAPPFQCSALVDLNETAVSDHVSGKDCSQFLFHPSSLLETYIASHLKSSELVSDCQGRFDRPWIDNLHKQPFNWKFRDRLRSIGKSLAPPLRDGQSVSMRTTSFLLQNAPFLAAGALMTFMSSFGQTFFISLFAGEIRAAFGLSHGQWGGIYAVGTTLSAIVMVWAGGLTDRFRVRVLGPLVLVGLATACLAMALNHYAWALPVVIFALRFFGQGMSSHIAVVAMARWFVATRGRALSIATLGFAIGEATLPVLFAALMTIVDWRYLWIVGVISCIVGVPVLGKLLGQERTPGASLQGESNTGMKGMHWTRRQTLRNPLFWAMLPAVLGPSAFNTAFFFHQVHFAEIKGLRHVELVSFFPIYTLMSVGAMVLSGWALDRVGTARLTPYYQLPMAVAFVIFTTATGPMSLFLGVFFMALTTGANSTLPNAFWAEFYGTAHIGSIKAMAAAVMVLGSAIGPGLTGLLIDLGIGLEDQFIAVAAFFVLASVLMALGIGRAKRGLQ